MTEQELVQRALAGLPRPTPPPRLHRAVMASVAAEARAEAAASSIRSWSRTEEGGWTTERWEGAGTSFDILGVTEAEVEAALTLMLDKDRRKTMR